MDCCNTHIIDSKVGDSIGLDTRTEYLSMTVLGLQTEAVWKVANITVDSVNGFSVDLRNACYGKIIGSVPDELPSLSDIANLDYCKGITFEQFLEDAVVVEKLSSAQSSLGYGNSARNAMALWIN